MASWFDWLAKCENVRWRSHVHVDCRWKVFKLCMSWAAEEQNRRVYSQNLCKNSEQKRAEDVGFCKRTVVSSSRSSFLKILFSTVQNHETKSSITEGMIRTLWSWIWRYFVFKVSERYVDVLPDFHDPAMKHFIVAWNEVITDGYNTTNSPLCNKSVKLTARCKQIFLQLVKFFLNASAFVFVCFLKVLSSLSLHQVRQTSVSNLCSRTSFRLSQHEIFFCSVPW